MKRLKFLCEHESLTENIILPVHDLTAEAMKGISMAITNHDR